MSYKPIARVLGWLSAIPLDQNSRDFVIVSPEVRLLRAVIHPHLEVSANILSSINDGCDSPEPLKRVDLHLVSDPAERKRRSMPCSLNRSSQIPVGWHRQALVILEANALAVCDIGRFRKFLNGLQRLPLNCFLRQIRLRSSFATAKLDPYRTCRPGSCCAPLRP